MNLHRTHAGFTQAERRINSSICPIKLQIGSEIIETIGKNEPICKKLIIDPKQIQHWIKACMLDSTIDGYIREQLPLPKWKAEKMDTLLIPNLKMTKPFQKWFKEKRIQRTYTPNEKFLHNKFRAIEQQKLEEKIKDYSLQTVVLNKISELAFADLLDDILQNILTEKGNTMKTINSVSVYKANAFDDTKKGTDFFVLIEHKTGKKSCLAIDLTTSSDEEHLSKKDAFSSVKQSDFQSFLIDKYKHTFGNDKELFNKKINEYQNTEINRVVLHIDKSLLTYYLRDYIEHIVSHHGEMKSGDALSVFTTLVKKEKVLGNAQDILQDIASIISDTTTI